MLNREVVLTILWHTSRRYSPYPSPSDQLRVSRGCVVTDMKTPLLVLHTSPRPFHERLPARHSFSLFRESFYRVSPQVHRPSGLFLRPRVGDVRRRVVETVRASALHAAEHPYSRAAALSAADRRRRRPNCHCLNAARLGCDERWCNADDRDGGSRCRLRVWRARVVRRARGGLQRRSRDELRSGGRVGLGQDDGAARDRRAAPVRSPYRGADTDRRRGARVRALARFPSPRADGLPGSLRLAASAPYHSVRSSANRRGRIGSTRSKSGSSVHSPRSVWTLRSGFVIRTRSREGSGNGSPSPVH